MSQKLTLRLVRQFRGTMRREIMPRREFDLDGVPISEDEGDRLRAQAVSVEVGRDFETYEPCLSV